MDFKVGDIVVLNSGGPEMTIESIGPLSFYSKMTGAHCCWFDNSVIKRDSFPLEILKITKEKRRIRKNVDAPLNV